MSVKIIDALLVTLGLDGSAFLKTAAEATKAQKKLGADTRTTGREIDTAERRSNDERKKRQHDQDQRARSTVDGYKKIRNEVLALAAIFTAGVGIKDFVSNTINQAASLGYLSANLKMSIADIQAYGRASERANGSTAGLVAQFKASSDALGQLKAGMGPNSSLQNFFRWGGTDKDLKDSETHILAMSRIVSEMFKRDPGQAMVIAKEIGVLDDQFDFMKQGPELMKAQRDAQMKNTAVTEKDAAAAHELQVQMLDLRDSLQATATRVILQLAPALKDLFAQLEKGAIWVAQWVATSIVAVREFIGYADDVAKSLGGWKNVLIGLAALKIASILAPLASLALGLAGVGASLAGVVAGAAGVPLLVAALAALAAYGGYKAAEFAFGDKTDKVNEELGAESKRRNAEIMAGGTGRELSMPRSPKQDGDDRRANADIMKGGSGRPLAYMSLRDQVANAIDAGMQNNAGAAGNADARAKYIMEKLKATGWTPEQAAGITASFKQENATFDPDKSNPKSGAYGMGQWLSKDRIADFKKTYGRDIRGSTLDNQIDFFNHETAPDGSEAAAGRKLRATKTAEDAARVHSEAYERPGSDEANVARRQRLAAQLASVDRMSNAAAALRIPAGAQASAPNVSTDNRTSTATHETTIENINITTQATDARGIADSIRPALGKLTFATQANTGMQ